MNDFTLTAKELLEAALLKYAPSPFPRGAFRSEALKYIPRSGKVHCGAPTLAGWLDAANGKQEKKSRCHLGYVIGLLPPSMGRATFSGGLPSSLASLWKAACSARYVHLAKWLTARHFYGNPMIPPRICRWVWRLAGSR